MFDNMQKLANSMIAVAAVLWLTGYVNELVNKK